jgi:hypothetical protein
MISPTRITDELNRCINIRYNLIELYIDATIWGYANRIYRTVKDIMTLYALEKTLYNTSLYSYTDTQIENIIYKIREYLGILNYTSKVDYFLSRYPSVACPSTFKGPYIEPKFGSTSDITYVINNFYPTSYITEKSVIIDNTEWFKQELTSLILLDGQTTITPLDFNVANVDIDTLRLEVQGDDSHYNTDISKDGYHIVSNTLHWHSFYDLKVGMQVTIKWRKE